MSGWRQSLYPWRSLRRLIYHNLQVRQNIRIQGAVVKCYFAFMPLCSFNKNKPRLSDSIEVFLVEAAQGHKSEVSFYDRPFQFRNFKIEICFKICFLLVRGIRKSYASFGDLLLCLWVQTAGKSPQDTQNHIMSTNLTISICQMGLHGENIR